MKTIWNRRSEILSFAGLMVIAWSMSLVWIPLGLLSLGISLLLIARAMETDE